MLVSDAIFEIPVGLIAIGMFGIYHFLEWYIVERISTLPIKQKEQPYEAECTELMAETNEGEEKTYIDFTRYNEDGSLNLHYYSIGDHVQPSKEERKAPEQREISQIEGTETEDLWNELQEAVSEIEGSESTKLIDTEPSIEEEIEQLQERINELSELEVQHGEDHLKEIIICLHKKMELEGNQMQMKEIEKQYPEFFGGNPILEDTTDVEEQNVVTFEQQRHTIKGTDLPDCFEEYATHTVVDSYIGEQTWYGKILEKNQASYILFTDGTKEVWIFADQKANRLEIGQLVLIDVLRDYDHITLKKAILLKHKTERVKPLQNVL